MPQVAGDTVKETGSPVTAAPEGLVTVATIVEVAVPLAGTEVGLAVTVTLLFWVVESVWVILVEPEEPVVASVAVMVQKPGVPDAV